MQKKRRKFLASLGKASFLGVSLGMLGGCFESKRAHGIRHNTDKRKEVLYTKTKRWELYYKRAY